MTAELTKQITQFLRVAYARQSERAERNCSALGAWLDRQVESSRPLLWLSFCAFLSFMMACTANLGALLISTSFLLVARGEWIRPMGLPGVEFGLAALGVLAVPLGLFGLFGRRKLPALLGILLGLTPYFLFESVFRGAMAVRDFHLSQ
jgi:hypothetical protein